MLTPLSPNNSPGQPGSANGFGPSGDAHSGAAASAAARDGRSPNSDEPDLGNRAAQAAGGVRRESELSSQERRELQELKTRDRAVRAHEQAHIAAAGSLARGGASFEYKEGPDGKRYAVGGEVDVDTGKVSGDPEATIDKARRIRQAALAPVDPSAQDRRIAAKATSMEQTARLELARERGEEAGAVSGGQSGSSATTTPASRIGSDDPTAPAFVDIYA